MPPKHAMGRFFALPARCRTCEKPPNLKTLPCKTEVMDTRPLPLHPPIWRPKGCERIALVLQGGGALGAYQAGVYQALHEANIEPDWVCGVSIGAINSAIIAGNPPD